MSTHNPRVAESVSIDRRGRKVGSDDILAAATVCSWPEEAGLRGVLCDVALATSKALKIAAEWAAEGRHEEAAKKATSCAYVLTRNERVGKMTLMCRDGKRRTVAQVAEFFGKAHFAITSQILDAKKNEAAFKEKKLQAALAGLAARRAREAEEAKQVA